MKINLINILILITLLFSCKTQKALLSDCEMPKEDLSQKAYEEALENWEACLVNQRIKEKSKKMLYEEIKGNRISIGILEGIEAEVSSKYLSSKALRNILTDKELIHNLQSLDPCIKYNSFFALTERKHQEVFEALKTIISDTTKIETQYGCIVEEMILADLCINTVTEIYFNNYEGYTPSQYQLTPAEKTELDKLIINSNYNLEYKKYLIKDED